MELDQYFIEYSRIYNFLSCVREYHRIQQGTGLFEAKQYFEKLSEEHSLTFGEKDVLKEG